MVGIRIKRWIMGKYKRKEKKGLNDKLDLARMAEWSKAVDLSPTISGCAGSNPASRIFFSLFVFEPL